MEKTGILYIKAGADDLYDYNGNNIIHGSGGCESDCSRDEIYCDGGKDDKVRLNDTDKVGSKAARLRIILG